MAIKYGWPQKNFKVVLWKASVLPLPWLLLLHSCQLLPQLVHHLEQQFINSPSSRNSSGQVLCPAQCREWFNFPQERGQGHILTSSWYFPSWQAAVMASNFSSSCCCRLRTCLNSAWKKIRVSVHYVNFLFPLLWEPNLVALSLPGSSNLQFFASLSQHSNLERVFIEEKHRSVSLYFLNVCWMKRTCSCMALVFFARTEAAASALIFSLSISSLAWCGK